jgi:DNA-directed RNA polymerase specialized sigma24 family protein
MKRGSFHTRRAIVFIPNGSSEAEVLATIEVVVRVLAPQFKIPGFGIDDIAQELRVMGMEALPRYDPRRPLPNFLYSHMRKRIINFRRDHLTRTDSPCRQCRDGIQHEPGPRCEAHKKWAVRQDRKKALQMTPQFDQELFDPGMPGDVTVEDAATKELLELVDQQLPVELRTSYLKMRAGVTIPPKRREQVEEAVREIIGMDLCKSGPCYFAS